MPTPSLITPSLQPLGVPVLPLTCSLNFHSHQFSQSTAHLLLPRNGLRTDTGPLVTETATSASQLATLAPGWMHLQAQLRGRNRSGHSAPPNTVNSTLLSVLLTCSHEIKNPLPSRIPVLPCVPQRMTKRASGISARTSHTSWGQLFSPFPLPPH